MGGAVVEAYDPEFEPTTAERIARNDSIFREANERLASAVEGYGPTARLFFICECADPACRELIPLTLEQYREIRVEPIRFLHIPGHDGADNGFARVLEERGHYVIVEKLGRAAEEATNLAETDPLATPRVEEGS
jgi:hypothetical protein